MPGLRSEPFGETHISAAIRGTANNQANTRTGHRIGIFCIVVLFVTTVNGKKDKKRKEKNKITEGAEYSPTKRR